MVRKLAVALAFTLGLGGAGWAQAPEPVRPESEINLAVGQALTLRFPTSIAEVNVITEGVARASVQTDRVLTLLGLAPGRTMVLIFGTDKAQVYSTAVTVTPDPGRSVRIYGTIGAKADPDRATDYVEYYCNETSCGRADRDQPAGKTTSRSVTRTLRDGTIYSTTTNQP